MDSSTENIKISRENNDNKTGNSEILKENSDSVEKNTDIFKKDKPFTLFVIKIGTCSVDLSWSSVDLAQVYRVQQHYKYQGWRTVNWYPCP